MKFNPYTLRTGIILHFWTPTPTLPRWERELMEIAYHARSQYVILQQSEGFKS